MAQELSPVQRSLQLGMEGSSGISVASAVLISVYEEIQRELFAGRLIGNIECRVELEINACQWH